MSAVVCVRLVGVADVSLVGGLVVVGVVAEYWIELTLNSRLRFDPARIAKFNF